MDGHNVKQKKPGFKKEKKKKTNEYCATLLLRNTLNRQIQKGRKHREVTKRTVGEDRQDEDALLIEYRICVCSSEKKLCENFGSGMVA